MVETNSRNLVFANETHFKLATDSGSNLPEHSLWFGLGGGVGLGTRWKRHCFTGVPCQQEEREPVCLLYGCVFVLRMLWQAEGGSKHAVDNLLGGSTSFFLRITLSLFH